MNKRARKSRSPKLPRGASDAAIAAWVTRHDVFDRLDSGTAEIVEDHADLDALLGEALDQANTAQLNMRLPPAMKAALSRLAKSRTTDATTLARIWLAERLRRELSA